MSKSGSITLHNDLLTTVSAWLELGWSVIPIRGSRDLSNPKLPALASWKAYQQRPPSQAEIQRWFAPGSDYAAAVVLGRVSGLVVVDLDDVECMAAFNRLYPDLTQTLTILSGNRGLPHYYFRIPPGCHVPSLRIKGAELRSEGQYVVGPGTRIGERHWAVMRDQMPLELSERDLSRLLAFFDCRGEIPPLNAGKPLLNVIPAYPEPQHEPIPLTASGLARRYRQLATRQGRNHALFSMACHARDYGWSVHKALLALTDVHAHQLPVGRHHHETAQQRIREAHRTISSAFKRLPRKKPEKAANGQLPNTLREKLLQLGLDNLARILDGLLIAGFKAGESFTAAMAYNGLKAYGIGKNIIFEMLKTLIDGGITVFERVKSSFPLHPLSPTANAAKRSAMETKQCLFGRVAKPGKIRGRKSNLFVMPDIPALCGRFGVKFSASDTLKPDDLRSPAAYRAALHTALIRRVPGQYPRRWQAERLGISKDTCRRYERGAGVICTPTYGEWALSWGNLEKIIPDERMNGQFMEDENGKRYPGIMVLAQRLMKQGRRLIYKKQDANDYRLPDEYNAYDAYQYRWQNERLKATPISAHPSPQQKQTGLAAVARLTASPATTPETPCHPLQRRLTTYQLPDPDRPPLILKSQPMPLDSSDDETQPLPDDGAKKKPQQAAPISDAPPGDWLYTALRQINPEKSLTRKKARQIIRTYGAEQVKKALKVMASRRQIQNPAGFLLVWLRSESVDQSGAKAAKTDAKPEAENALTWG